ncbi:hypothetical protein M153_4850004617 [Pseudoloma neurophilia]|uniref:Uncharacterized protein n=1 Tax=Pseudoloma neurophilia TaxID=146866 RepID=A0A0R0M655_9MICR|nr:hypothetical protein M153_4850004617 [Pseudoloma neurophilia]
MLVSLSIIHFECTGSKQIFFLVQKLKKDVKIFFTPVAAAIIEKKDTALFIEAIDTTGLFEPRDKQTYFTQSFILKIIEYLGYENHLECFSHPKPAMIFIKKNDKYLVNPKKLLNYWYKIFEIACQNVICWSNYLKKATFTSDESKILQYLSKMDMTYFDDDPKRKLNKFLIEKHPMDQDLIVETEKEGSNPHEDSKQPEEFSNDLQKSSTKKITDSFDKQDFFRILLTRRDFNAGGLVIGQNKRVTRELRHIDEPLLRNLSSQMTFIEKIAVNCEFEVFLNLIHQGDWCNLERSDQSLREIISKITTKDEKISEKEQSDALIFLENLSFNEFADFKVNKTIEQSSTVLKPRKRVQKQ